MSILYILFFGIALTGYLFIIIYVKRANIKKIQKQYGNRVELKVELFNNLGNILLKQFSEQKDSLSMIKNTIVTNPDLEAIIYQLRDKKIVIFLEQDLNREALRQIEDSTTQSNFQELGLTRNNQMTPITQPDQYKKLIEQIIESQKFINDAEYINSRISAIKLTIEEKFIGNKQIIMDNRNTNLLQVSIISYLTYFYQDIQRQNYPQLIPDLIEIYNMRNIRNNTFLLKSIVKSKQQIESKDDNLRSFSRIVGYLSKLINLKSPETLPVQQQLLQVKKSNSHDIEKGFHGSSLESQTSPFKINQPSNDQIKFDFSQSSNQFNGRSRQESATIKNDLLSVLLKLEIQEKEILIIYLFFQFFLQWTDNQFNLFQMIIYQLSTDQDYQVQLSDKVLAKLKWDQINYSNLDSVPELNYFFLEIQRIYDPNPIKIFQQKNKKVKSLIKDYELSHNDMLVILNSPQHLNPKFHQAPLNFTPGRWAPLSRSNPSIQPPQQGQSITTNQIQQPQLLPQNQQNANQPQEISEEEQQANQQSQPYDQQSQQQLVSLFQSIYQGIIHPISDLKLVTLFLLMKYRTKADPGYSIRMKLNNTTYGLMDFKYIIQLRKSSQLETISNKHKSLQNNYEKEK